MKTLEKGLDGIERVLNKLVWPISMLICPSSYDKIDITTYTNLKCFYRHKQQAEKAKSN